jgi:hypothetical protein
MHHLLCCAEQIIKANSSMQLRRYAPPLNRGVNLLIESKISITSIRLKTGCCYYLR